MAVFENVRVRSFHNPATGALWGTRTDGFEVAITSGKPGKEKVVAKPQADALATRRFLDKEEGARLRKGFLLVNPQAAPGEPMMLRYLDKGYTGAMSLAFLDGGLVVNQFSDDRDSLWLIGRDGEGGPVMTMEETRLIWKIVPVPALGMYLLRADHQVLSWSPSTQQCIPLTSSNPRPASVVDCAGLTAAWYEEPHLVVRNLETGTDVFRLWVDPDLYSGHSLQLAAALSHDGSLVACCSEPGVIVISEVAGGGERAVLRGDFAMVDELAFTPDGRRLVVKEKYGRWRLLSFDVATWERSADWPDFGDLGNGSFALDGASARMALSVRDKARIYDMSTFELLREITVDQCVKRFVAAWTDDGLLAVRTDLSVVGVYAV